MGEVRDRQAGADRGDRRVTDRRYTAAARELRALRGRTDKQLGMIADECWARAKVIREPTRWVIERGVERRVLGAEEDVAANDDPFTQALVDELRKGRRRPRGSKYAHTLQWAVFLMMTRLLEWSTYDVDQVEMLRVAGQLERAAELARASFPYPNAHAAAVAVVQGFANASAEARNSALTANQVLRRYERHYRNR